MYAEYKSRRLPVSWYLSSSPERDLADAKRTAHFDRWLHFARELYLKNAIKIYLTTTDKMMADIMTKPTDKTIFLRCCAYILTDGHVD